MPEWKIFTTPEAGNGLGARATAYHGSTRHFPGTLPLRDGQPGQNPNIPLTVEITGWSPFVPGDADSSSLPVAALELTVP